MTMQILVQMTLADSEDESRKADASLGVQVAAVNCRMRTSVRSERFPRWRVYEGLQ